MKNNKLIIVIAAALLLLLSVPSALSYIFTYTKENLQNDIELKYSTWMKEDPDYKECTKTLRITADEDSDYVFVRAIAFSDTGEPIIYEGAHGESTKWHKGDQDYWYYSDPIKDGDKAEDLIVYFGEVPANAKIGEDYHVVVLYEGTPALFSETPVDGAWPDPVSGFWYADWSDEYLLSGQGD